MQLVTSIWLERSYPAEQTKTTVNTVNNLTPNEWKRPSLREERLNQF